MIVKQVSLAPYVPLSTKPQPEDFFFLFFLGWRGVPAVLKTGCS